MCGYCLFSWFVDVSCHRSLLRGTRYAKHLFLGSQRIPSLKLEKPIKIDHPNSKKVFQSSIFRCYVFFSGRVTRISQIPFCVANYETIYICVYTSSWWCQIIEKHENQSNWIISPQITGKCSKNSLKPPQLYINIMDIGCDSSWKSQVSPSKIQRKQDVDLILGYILQTTSPQKNNILPPLKK